MIENKVRDVAIVLILVIVLACVGIRLIASSIDFDFFSSSINDPSLLGINAEFEVPESARNAEGHFSGLNSFSMSGKFDMDPADFEMFAANANCSSPFRPLNDSEILHRRDSRFDWWQPSEQSLICSGGSDGCGKTLIVDISDPDVYTVYVRAGCG